MRSLQNKFVSRQYETLTRYLRYAVLLPAISQLFSTGAFGADQWNRVLDGSGVDIGVGAQGHVWAVGGTRVDEAGNTILKFSPESWNVVPGISGARIAAGQDDSAMVVTLQGEIFLWDGNERYHVEGSATDVGIGANGTVWIIGVDNSVYKYMTDETWQPYAGPPPSASIAVDPTGKPWVVTLQGEIFHRDGDGKWLAVEGPAFRGDFFRPGVGHEPPLAMKGIAWDIGIGADGTVWITGVDNSAHKWTSKTNTWQRIDGEHPWNISVDPVGKAWMVATPGGIYQWHHPCSASDWWSMSTHEFFSQCIQLATGTQAERSEFAWMLFARLNQPQKESAPDGKGDDTFTTWELWASNPDTFPERGHAPMGAPTDRNGPKVSKSAKSQIADEERTRNSISYEYIENRQLYKQSIVERILGSNNPSIDFPVGSIEIKAHWTKNPHTNMYRIEADEIQWGLDGLHVMAKIAPNPSNVDDPSWFWATFEFKRNKGRKNALRFITHPDALSSVQSARLLSQAGLGKPWTSYGLNGTQIAFVDDAGNPVILGNTTMESFAGVPKGSKASEWTAWESSCHTCHYMSSGDGSTLQPFPGPPTFPHYPTGHMTLTPGYNPIDFEWSIPFNAK